ncbi:unnamed protein product [Timema podura]|uniref:Uncharacterized protein n=1 Tax=Timema podura TaxID=61482 RepID=A0ABN7NLD9_TIMPD|nr:unnamed protein product [Timema podura]
MARYGSPALDLANLLYCCTSLELRQNYMDNLLEHYHTTLITAIIELEKDRCSETFATAATQPEYLREIFCPGWYPNTADGGLTYYIVEDKNGYESCEMPFNPLKAVPRPASSSSPEEIEEEDYNASNIIALSIMSQRFNCLEKALSGVASHCLRHEALKVKARLREEMHRCGKFGLGLALDMIPISTCDSDQAPDLYVTSHDDVLMKEEGPVVKEADSTLQLFTATVQEAYRNNTIVEQEKHDLRRQHPDLDFLFAQKREARRAWQTYRAPQHRAAYKRLTAQVRRKVKTIKHDNWNTYITDATLDPRKIWKVAKQLKSTNKRSVPAIHGEHSMAYTSSDKAEAIAEIYKDRNKRLYEQADTHTNEIVRELGRYDPTEQRQYKRPSLA